MKRPYPVRDRVPFAARLDEVGTATAVPQSADLQPLPFPDALDPSVADRPARLAQQNFNLAIAVAAILAGQLNDAGRQPFGILTAPRDLALLSLPRHIGPPFMQNDILQVAVAIAQINAELILCS